MRFGSRNIKRSIARPNLGSWRVGPGLRGFAAVCALSAATLLVSVASAEPNDADRATARTLAQEGYAALQAKDFRTARDRFKRASDLVHAPTLLRDLARAQLGLGELVEAQENYNRILREGVPESSPPSWTRALEDAARELEALKPRVPLLTLSVDGPENPVVTLDGEPYPVAALDAKRPVNPGKHELLASGEGYLEGKKSFSIGEGDTLEVEIELEEAPETPEAAPDEATPEAAETPQASWRKPATYAAFGVGGAGLVVGSIAGVLAITKHSKLADACADGHCPPSRENDVQSYRTAGTISTIGFVVAGVGAAAGVVLIFTAPNAHPSEMQAARVTPFVALGNDGASGADLGSLGVKGSF
jgi:hypothetical protein